MSCATLLAARPASSYDAVTLGQIFGAAHFFQATDSALKFEASVACRVESMRFGICRREQLLRFLQERVIERIGGRQPISVDTRIVCATHQDLEAMIAAGSFREDLYYRLAEIVVKIPSLAERSGDAVLLARHFVNRFGRELNPGVQSLSPDAIDAISTYAWPGNVRELENRVKRAVIMADGKSVTAGDLDLQAGMVPSSDVLPINLRAAREVADRKAIRQAMSHADNNISSAAKLLGISRPTLYDLLKQYRLSA